MDRWALSETDVQAPWDGMLETMWLHCDESQQVGCSARLTKAANIAIATGPAVLCVKFVLQYMPGWMLELSCPSKTLKKGALYFTQVKQKLYSLKPR